MHACMLRMFCAMLFLTWHSATVCAQHEEHSALRALYVLGQYQAASELGERLAEKSSADTGDTIRYAATISWLALTDYMLDRFEKAEQRGLQALRLRENEITQPTIAQPSLAEIHYTLADIYRRQKRTGEVRLSFRRALETHDASGGLSPPMLRRVLFLLADAEESEQRNGEAVELYLRALANRDDRTIERLRAIARQFKSEERLVEAENLYRRTLQLTVTHHISERLMLPVLHDLIDLYLRQGRDSDADRIFVLLADMRGNSRDCADASHGEEAGLRSTLQKYEEAKLGFKRKEQTDIFVVTPTMRKELRLTTRPSNEVIADIASRLDRLSTNGNETAALVYDGTKCVYMITRSGFELAEPVSSKPDPIISHIGFSGAIRAALDLDARLAARQPKKRKPTASSSLAAPLAEQYNARAALRIAADLLLPRSIQDRIKSKNVRRVLILAGGDLSTIPFAALPFGAGALIDVATTVVLADIDGLFSSGADRFRATAGRKIVIGDPDLKSDPTWVFAPLPSANKEATDVAGLLGTSAMTGKQADKKSVFSLITREQSSASLIYFATHGIADAENPMDASFLALKDGHLYAREIRKFKLAQQPLVVMSACQSGLGKSFAGGVFGLARAWHFAGAAQVIMSLWDIDDAATQLLMTEFVRTLGQGETVEDALRAGMFKARTAYPTDPARWASVTVSGSPTLQ